MVLLVVSSMGITVLLSRLNSPLSDAAPLPVDGRARSSREALQAEIERRRPALAAERAAIEAERRVIQVDRKRLEAMQKRIERRRQRGVLPVEQQLHQLDTIEYNRRSDALRARVFVFNKRIEAQRQAVEEFNRLVGEYNAGR
jgi:chromosome segregation ATPase